MTRGAIARRRVDAVLARFRWTLIEELPAGGGSSFLGRVRDANGRELLLKRASGVRGYAEYRLLRVWSGHPFVPGGPVYIDYRTHAREWVQGEHVSAIEPISAELARDAGTALRALHAAKPPRGVPQLRDLHLAPGARYAGWSGRLPEEWQRRARELAITLSDARVPDDALLHGDAVPINVIRSQRGPCSSTRSASLGRRRGISRSSPSPRLRAIRGKPSLTSCADTGSSLPGCRRCSSG